MADPLPSGDRAAPQQWVLRSRDLLEQSARDLDGVTLSRLTRARHAALDTLVVPPPRYRLFGWLGGGAIAAGLALMVWRGLLPSMGGSDTLDTAQSPPPIATHVATSAQLSTPVAAPDFELLADAEGLALLEDLEFYAWLQAAEDHDG